jgi:hypothetical protein
VWVLIYTNLPILSQIIEYDRGYQKVRLLKKGKIQHFSTSQIHKQGQETKFLLSMDKTTKHNNNPPIKTRLISQLSTLTHVLSRLTLKVPNFFLNKQKQNYVINP